MLCPASRASATDSAASASAGCQSPGAVSEVGAQDERLVEHREAAAATRVGDHVVEQRSHARRSSPSHISASAAYSTPVRSGRRSYQRTVSSSSVRARTLSPRSASTLPNDSRTATSVASESRAAGIRRALQRGVERGLGVARDDGHGRGVAERDRTELRLPACSATRR